MSESKQERKEGGVYGDAFLQPNPWMSTYVYVGASGGNSGSVLVEYYANQEGAASSVVVMAEPDDDFCQNDPPVGGTSLKQNPNDPSRWVGCVPGVSCPGNFKLGARADYPSGWSPCNTSTFTGECSNTNCRNPLKDEDDQQAV